MSDPATYLSQPYRYSHQNEPRVPKAKVDPYCKVYWNRKLSGQTRVEQVRLVESRKLQQARHSTPPLQRSNGRWPPPQRPVARPW